MLPCGKILPEADESALSLIRTDEGFDSPLRAQVRKMDKFLGDSIGVRLGLINPERQITVDGRVLIPERGPFL